MNKILLGGIGRDALPDDRHLFRVGKFLRY